MRASRLLVIVGGIILVIGAFLPWISVPVLFGLEDAGSRAIEIGWEDNGLVTRGIGFLLVLGAVLGRGRPKVSYAAAGGFLALMAVMVVAGCMWRIIEIGPSEGFFAAADVGLYVTLGGGLIALAGSLLHLPVMELRSRIQS